MSQYKALNDNRRTELGRIKTTELFSLFDYVITQTVQAQCTICSIQGIMEQDLYEKSGWIVTPSICPGLHRQKSAYLFSLSCATLFPKTNPYVSSVV